MAVVLAEGVDVAADGDEVEMHLGLTGLTIPNFKRATYCSQRGETRASQQFCCAIGPESKYR